MGPKAPYYGARAAICQRRAGTFSRLEAGIGGFAFLGFLITFCRFVH